MSELPHDAPTSGDPDLEAVLLRFPDLAGGVARVSRPDHAAIARVWLLEDRFVLRARALAADTLREFHREQALLELARPVIPARLPAPIASADGARYVIHGDALWTLYHQLPGRIRCPWQTLHRAPESERRCLVTSLRALHDATRGKLNPVGSDWVLRGVRARLDPVAPLLSTTARVSVERALSGVAAARTRFGRSQCAFVHGDFHWGNLLVDDHGEVVALLDLDWCRVGHPLEDLAYTAMMLLRDYDSPTPRFDELDRILDWYDPQGVDRSLFDEYLVLYALFDVHLFWAAADLTDRSRYLQYQLWFLEALTQR